nr:hypothetical protein [Tanacetum cinerariifolium]
MMSKSFESVQKHAINLELELQQCKENVKNDMSFKVNKSKDFCKEREQYFEIQDLKAQLQDKGIVIRVILTTSVSRPQLKSNPQGDRVLCSNSRGKKLEIEEQRRNVKLPKNKTSVTACNDSLNAKTLNVKSVSAMCAKCEVNSRAKIQFYKTRNSNKPVDQKSHTQKPGRQIFTRHRFSPNKTSVVYEKTSPRSDLRWKPTGRIFKSVGLRWIPTGKLFDSCTSKDASEPTHGSNADIPNIHESKQTLDLSACTSINVQKEQGFDLSAELESLFGPSLDEYFNGQNQVVSKPSAVTTADASDKRKNQPDLTPSTSTLATTVTADGNFDL